MMHRAAAEWGSKDLFGWTGPKKIKDVDREEEEEEEEDGRGEIEQQESLEVEVLTQIWRWEDGKRKLQVKECEAKKAWK